MASSVMHWSNCKLVIAELMSLGSVRLVCLLVSINGKWCRLPMLCMHRIWLCTRVYRGFWLAWEYEYYYFTRLKSSQLCDVIVSAGYQSHEERFCCGNVHCVADLQIICRSPIFRSADNARINMNHWRWSVEAHICSRRVGFASLYLLWT
jgi:hypothetical protein